MSNISNIGGKWQPVKWLFGLMMLFSIFTFAGFSGGIEQDFRQAVKTEVAISRDVKIAKRTISYKRGYVLYSQHASASDFDQNFKHLTRTYNRLVKVKLDRLVLQKCSFNNHIQYFRIHIPENSDDDVSIAG